MFSSDAVSLGSFTGRRQSLKRALRKIKKLQALGDSDLNAGLTQALKNAASHKGTQSIKQVMSQRWIVRTLTHPCEYSDLLSLLGSYYIKEILVQ